MTDPTALTPAEPVSGLDLEKVLLDAMYAALATPGRPGLNIYEASIAVGLVQADCFGLLLMASGNEQGKEGVDRALGAVYAHLDSLRQFADEVAMKAHRALDLFGTLLLTPEQSAQCDSPSLDALPSPPPSPLSAALLARRKTH